MSAVFPIPNKTFTNTVLDKVAIASIAQIYSNHFRKNRIQKFTLTPNEALKYMLQNILDPPTQSTFTQYSQHRKSVMLLVEVLEQFEIRLEQLK